MAFVLLIANLLNYEFLICKKTGILGCPFSKTFTRCSTTSIGNL